MIRAIGDVDTALAVLAAWLRTPEPLLGENSPVPPVVRKQGAGDQYYYAIEQDTEEAWQSVWEYFPPTQEPRFVNERYVLLAKLRLAEFYRARLRLDEAMKIYDEVVAYETSDPQYRGFALAGQANLYAARGESTMAQVKLEQLSGDVLPKLDSRYYDQIQQYLDEPLQPTLQQYLAQRRSSST